MKKRRKRPKCPARPKKLVMGWLVDDVSRTSENVVSRMPEYVDDRDLERLTPIKRVTWQLMRVRRSGPRWFKLGRRCIYKLVDVRAWIEQHARDDSAVTPNDRQ